MKKSAACTCAHLVCLSFGTAATQLQRLSNGVYLFLVSRLSMLSVPETLSVCPFRPISQRNDERGRTQEL